MSIGLKIKDMRERAHLSQVELASRTGVGQTTISKIERGEMDGNADAPSVRKALSVLASITTHSTITAESLPPMVVPKPQPDVELAAERIVGEAIVPSRDLPRDATAVARLVAADIALGEHDRATLAAAARVWLDAAADLRAANIPITAGSLLVQSTVALLRAKPR
jgi:hypothetical protein